MDYTSNFFGVLCSPRRYPNDDGEDNVGRSWFKAMRQENYNDKADKDGGGQYNGWGDPPIYGQRQ
jgi:hypothetical protein